MILRLEKFMQDHAGEVLTEIASAVHSKDHSKDVAFATKAWRNKFTSTYS